MTNTLHEDREPGCGLCPDLGHLFLDDPHMPCPWCAPDDYEPRLLAIAAQIRDGQAAELDADPADEPVPYLLTDAAMAVLSEPRGAEQ